MTGAPVQLPSSRELDIQLYARTLLTEDAVVFGVGHPLSLTPERARELAEQALAEATS
jgi:hypothetical protein